MITLKTMLGDYPITAPLKSGDVRSEKVQLDIVDVSKAQTAFRRVVRDVEFDVAEIAIVTFLMAKAKGVPLTLLPAVVLGRYQHPFLLYNAERGELSPQSLAGKRIGIRAWTVTTVMWVRGLLANEYGVDLDSIHWVTFEDAHVAGFEDPPGVERAAPDKDLKSMLLGGEVDAIILPGPNDDPRLKPVIADPSAAIQAWREKHHALHVNHLVSVRTSLCGTEPAAVAEVYRMLTESKRQAGLDVAAGEEDIHPFGLERIRHSLEIAIDYTYQQGLIPERFTVDSLFEPASRFG